MDRIEAGCFYMIDHAKLPDDAPTVLSTLRAVLVSSKTEQHVTIRYPSSQSLQTFFAVPNDCPFRTESPVTNETYVMGPKLATQVIGHKIPSIEFVENRKCKSF